MDQVPLKPPRFLPHDRSSNMAAKQKKETGLVVLKETAEPEEEEETLEDLKNIKINHVHNQRL